MGEEPDQVAGKSRILFQTSFVSVISTNPSEFIVK